MRWELSKNYFHVAFFFSSRIMAGISACMAQKKKKKKHCISPQVWDERVFWQRTHYKVDAEDTLTPSWFCASSRWQWTFNRSVMLFVYPFAAAWCKGVLLKKSLSIIRSKIDNNIYKKYDKKNCADNLLDITFCLFKSLIGGRWEKVFKL